MGQDEVLLVSLIGATRRKARGELGRHWDAPSLLPLDINYFSTRST